MDLSETQLNRASRLSNLLFRSFNPDDKAAVTAIAHEAFGPGYFDTEGKGENIEVVENAGHIVAFCYAKEHIDSIEERFGLIKTLAIDSNHQKQGIGTELVERAINRFESRNINYVAYLAWMRHGQVPMESLLLRLKFTRKAILKKNWYRESLKLGYSCPDCGSPCVCDAVWYERELK